MVGNKLAFTARFPGKGCHLPVDSSPLDRWDQSALTMTILKEIFHKMALICQRVDRCRGYHYIGYHKGYRVEKFLTYSIHRLHWQTYKTIYSSLSCCLDDGILLQPPDIAPRLIGIASLLTWQSSGGSFPSRQTQVTSLSAFCLVHRILTRRGSCALWTLTDETTRVINNFKIFVEFLFVDFSSIRSIPFIT